MHAAERSVAIGIESATVGPFAENCWLVADPASRSAVLIDPGDEGARLVSLVRRADVTLEAVWITHAHLDHIGGIAAVRREFDVPVYLHPLDAPLYESGAAQAAHYGIAFDPPPSPDRTLAEGDLLSVGALRFAVWHVPGHAPGHVAFVGEGAVFGGDCLFAGSVGRTDLPFCDGAAFERSLQRLASLPHETVVYPGHGPVTTIGVERGSDPFLTGALRAIRRA
jgi:glyoxylase-like metal-dependent hydrolase (beta-lactamase superfamily II)